MYELQAARHFSPLDEMLPAIYYCYLVCFPLDSNQRDSTRQILTSSVSALAAERPYLAGTIRRELNSKVRKGHLILDAPTSSNNLKVVFNDLTDPALGWKETYEDLKVADMPPRKLDAKILAPLTAGIGETRNVMSLQANFISGGLILAFCFHHNFVDAYGAGRIIARFSDHCNGTASVVKRVLPNGNNEVLESFPDALNAEKLGSRYSFEELQNNSDLWRMNALAFKGVNEFRWPEFIPSSMPARNPPVVSMMFSLTQEAVKEIKDLAKQSDGKEWISTNDALVAFLWRHVMRARFPSSMNGGEQQDLKSNVMVALDGRKGLSISPTYIGNCVFHCSTELPINFVGNERTPLGEIAIKIRQSIARARDPELLQDVVGLAATHPDCQTIRYANDNLGFDLYTTSWIDLPVYQLEWGPLGKTDFFRIPDRHFESLCCILPPRNGVVELITSMEAGHSQRLRSDADFLKYAKYR